MSLFNSSVPAFIQILTSLSAVLDKAESHATAKNIQPDVLLNARLFPDMFPLSRQIQSSCDFAVRGCARLAQVEVPNTPNTEKSFSELKRRIATTIDYLLTFKANQFEGAETREITFPIGPDKSLTMKGQQALNHFVLPNFYFHSVTAYDILRHNGVELGKRDFLGPRE
jgi:hypothetical protein